MVELMLLTSYISYGTGIRSELKLQLIYAQCERYALFAKFVITFQSGCEPDVQHFKYDG